MKAFLNTTITKPELLKELKWHQKQDNFIKGTYQNESGKGCAVGCSLMSLSAKKDLGLSSFNQHNLYEEHFGVPEWLAWVEDTIFEGLDKDRSKKWPVEFIDAINIGSNLDKIKKPFIVFILKSNLENFDHDKYPDVKKAIDDVIALYEKDVWDRSARSAARLAASSAARSAAESAASSAARSAAELAKLAARSAELAAKSAELAWSAELAAWLAASSAAYEKFANELLRLMRECN